jgi:phenylacetic acid degradation protein
MMEVKAMPVYSLEGLTPVVHPDAFVHETAVLIGDVLIGAGCYIGPNASLRGDFGRIVVESGANVQDTCVMHSFPGKDCIVEKDGHIGHGAVLHGCRVGANALIGINAVVMDEVVIGAASIVGAMAFVPSGFTCPARSLVVGSPASVKRELSEQEIDWKTRGTAVYQALAIRCRQSLRKTSALDAPEADRPRIDMDKYTYKP